MKDYQKSISLNKPVNEVYTAITEHIGDWWSNDLSGAAANVGDSFAIAFVKTHKTFEITEAVPGKQVVWKCTQAHINWDALKNKAEWEGTKMRWELKPAGLGTELYFVHEGLNQNLQCYDVCENGWDTFLTSFAAYVNTGKGAPYLKKA